MTPYHFGSLMPIGFIYFFYFGISPRSAGLLKLFMRQTFSKESNFSHMTTLKCICVKRINTVTTSVIKVRLLLHRRQETRRGSWEKERPGETLKIYCARSSQLVATLGFN